MCTGVYFKDKNNNVYVGRNLDIPGDYHEHPLIMPRGYKINYRYLSSQFASYAVLGMGVNVNDYPLFFDSMNEKGLSIMGLEFTGKNFYNTYEKKDAINLASFELSLYLLENCQNINDVKKLVNKINITNVNFNEQFSSQSLHWMISDNESSIVLESTVSGIHLYNNDVGILTNSPEFPWHIENLNNYINLVPQEKNNAIWGKHKLTANFIGSGSLGLPGDSSSAARFVKAAYINTHYPTQKNEHSNVARLLNTLKAVSRPLGTVELNNGEFDRTVYSCCYSSKSKTYYYNFINDYEVKLASLNEINITGKHIINL